MSETKKPARSRGAPSFMVAAQGENVVLLDANNGRSWALASDAGHPVWQPITFKGQGYKAPKGIAQDDAE